MKQGYINHVGLVLDASGSMAHLQSSTIRVTDLQIRNLAERSKEMDQETRATIYTFDEQVKCIFYDKDVLRLPSIKDDYQIGGLTALVDATLKAIEDMKKTATLYGDHAFLLYVVTDGLENASKHPPAALRTILQSLPDNWTVAVFVPDAQGVHEAKKLGFAPGNITQWDATTERGVEELGKRIYATTQSYMTGRASGTRSYTDLFSIDTSGLTSSNVRGNMSPVPKYTLETVHEVEDISSFVARRTKRPYVTGQSYYLLTKRETVQPQKMVILRDKKDGSFWQGTAARSILGLPPERVMVDPVNAKFDIFVQSTSSNRKLIPGQQVLTLL